ncbi:MAG: hypothetical protein Q7R94_00925 [bacterium]|nr:hypothetical protein [bacterium]
MGETKSGSSGAKHRLQIDLTDQVLQEIDALRELAGFSNRDESIRHSLRQFQWTLDAVENDKAKIFIGKNGKTEEVVFMFWKVMNVPSSQGFIRYHLIFNFTAEVFQEVEDLQKRTGFLTPEELIRHSVRWSRWTLDETRGGATFFVEENGARREIDFPPWNN